MIEIEVGELGGRIGEEIAVGEWRTITQPEIDRFADVTGDRQWIHVDTARAQAELPSKSTIAHGFLTLSLISTLLREALRVTGVRMAINYGLNRVRFVSPVPSGTRIRGRFAPAEMKAEQDWIQMTWQVTVDREAAEKPACVAEWIVRYYPAAP